MAYKIRIKSSARKELARLPKAAQRKVARAIDKLSENPRHNQTEKLAGRDGDRRARAGNYRIIYQILDDQVVVFVIAIAAAEATVGLAIVLLIYRNFKGIFVDRVNLMKW